MDADQRLFWGNEWGASYEKLSSREEQVVFFLIKGATNREIAGRLHITPNTVKSHINSIFNKLGVQNRTQAAVKAVWLGITGGTSFGP